MTTKTTELTVTELQEKLEDVQDELCGTEEELEAVQAELDEALVELGHAQQQLESRGAQRTDLAEQVLRLHDDIHQHAARFCEFDMCRTADELVNGQRTP